MLKKFRVSVDGKPYDVTVEVSDDSDGISASVPAPAAAPVIAAPAPVAPAPTPVAPQPAAPPPQSAPAAKANSGVGAIPSPLAGRVITVVAKVGQEVKENEHLLTLEAMKMNTFVFAPKAGKVLEINVAVGDAVEEGQTLARVG